MKPVGKPYGICEKRIQVLSNRMRPPDQEPHEKTGIRADAYMCIGASRQQKPAEEPRGERGIDPQWPEKGSARFRGSLVETERCQRTSVARRYPLLANAGFQFSTKHYRSLFRVTTA